jgi:hypothetical protein
MPDRKQNQKSAVSAIRSFLQTNIGRWNVVPKSVQTESVQDTKVYNLTLEKHNAYYANSILVFNCLTFALPPSAYKKEEKETKEVIKGLAQSFNQKMLAMQKSRK